MDNKLNKLFQKFIFTSFILFALFLCLPAKNSIGLNTETKTTSHLTTVVSQKNFLAKDSPQIKITKKPPSAFTSLINSIFRRNSVNLQDSLKITVKNADGETVNPNLIQLQSNSDNEITFILDTNNSSLKPGKYSVEITDTQNNESITQDFTWGVLAINTNKSIYSPQELAQIDMAVLDSQGDMVCNAVVTLKISSPDNQTTTLSTQDGTIQVNPQCQLHEFSLIPDYETQYQTNNEGNYNLTLTAVTADGSYTINDSFEVKTDIPFDINRSTATRIYPLEKYPVTLTIKFNQDFTGTITETVPSGFILSKTTAAITQQDFSKLLTWTVSAKKDDILKLNYTYDSPDISPEFYLLGPLTFISQNSPDPIFAESRQWQIAVDATTEPITSNQNWVVPDGVSSIIVEAWGGGGGGGGGGGSNKNGGGGGAGGQYSKKTLAVSAGTTYAVVVGAGGVGPANGEGGAGYDTVFGTNLVVAKGGAGGQWYDTGGAGGIGTTALGVGDTVYKGGNGASGAATYSGGGGGGAGTTGAGVNASGMNLGTGTTAYGGDGGQGVNGNSTAGNNGSPYGGGGSGATKNGTSGNGYQGLVLVTYTISNQPPAAPGPVFPDNASTNQSVTPGFGFVATDPDSDYLQYEFKYCTNSAMSVGCSTFDQTANNTGWSNQDVGTSAYASGTLAVYTLQVGNSLAENQTIYWKTRAIDPAGSNTWSGTEVSAYSLTTGQRPNTPILVSPNTGATGISLTPSLVTVATDTNGDSLQYKIDLCTNSAMTTGCTTYTAADSGWSGADIGTSSFSSGTTATYVIQSNLNVGTSYFWRSYAVDYDGLNRWSATQGTPYSFVTTVGNQAPTAPTTLWTEGSVNPSGILDTTPEFSAIYTDPDASDIANKYQIQVDDDPGFGSLLWDSGAAGTSMTNCNQGSRCSDISYGGSALTRGTTYYWRIKYWDDDGAEGAFSTGTNTFSLNSVPATPVLTLPLNGATDVSTTPALKTVTTDTDNNPLQYLIILATNAAFTGTTQTFNQTVNNTNWSGQDVGTSAYATGTTATYTISSALANSTLYYWKSQAIDYSGTNTWSALSIGSSFTTAAPGNQAPTAPTTLWTEGSVNPSGILDTTPEFSAVYNDPDASDIANKYQIQVDDDPGFGSLLWDSGASGTAMTNCNQGSRCADISYSGSALTRGVTYSWRIKFWDDDGAAGPFSSAGTFSLNSIPNTPTLVSPANSATGVTNVPTLRTVATDADSNPLQYQIILATNAAFTGTTQTFNQTVSNIGWSAQNVGTSAYSSGTTAAYIIQTPLSYSTLYYWKSQAIDYSGTNTWSSLSIGYSFTTQAAGNNPPNAPTLVSPSNSATGVTLAPAFSTVTTDAEGNPVQYRLILGTNAAFTGTTQTFDQTVSNLGWSNQNVGTSAYSSGTTAVYTVQSNLNYSTVYHWKTQAKDYSGSNTWGNLSIGYSFTTQSNGLPPPTSLFFRLRNLKLRGIKFR